MNWRGLISVALLLASPALAQMSAEEATEEAAPTETVNADALLDQIRVECVAAWYAKTMIGKHACIAGRVYSITGHRGDAVLTLCPPNRECAFRAIVDKNDRDAVGDLSYFRGKVVAISGDVKNDHDNPRIFITQREQIKIAPGNPMEFDAAHHKPRVKVEHEKIPPPHKW